MSKKVPNFEMRKPSAARVEAFVAGAGKASGSQDSPASKRPNVKAPKRQAKPAAAVPDADRRRTTVYFTPDVFRRLKVHCAEGDAEMSEVVNAAVDKFLR